MVKKAVEAKVGNLVDQESTMANSKQLFDFSHATSGDHSLEVHPKVSKRKKFDSYMSHFSA